MKIDYADHYDEGYFTGKKTYKGPDGKEYVYHGPALTWNGFQPVAEALGVLLPKGTLLDIGCSAGDLARCLRQFGYDPYGIDISKYAVERCHPDMQQRLACDDITLAPKHLLSYAAPHEEFPEQFDNVIATDLLEHIYEDDLDPTFDWILAKTRKTLFFCVATTFDGAEFIAKKGEPIPVAYEGTAVSGHVNVRTMSYWLRYLQSKSLRIRYDLMYFFQVKRELHKQWRDTMGWNLQTTIFCERK